MKISLFKAETSGLRLDFFVRHTPENDGTFSDEEGNLGKKKEAGCMGCLWIHLISAFKAELLLCQLSQKVPLSLLQ
jgi:hypothetical protein